MSSSHVVIDTIDRRWIVGRGHKRVAPRGCRSVLVRHVKARSTCITGWLEVDTVALCGGSVAGEFVWMVDAVDYATSWVEMRAMWGRGQVGTLAALRDMEASLPFALLGLDSDNGGEFLNYRSDN